MLYNKKNTQKKTNHKIIKNKSYKNKKLLNKFQKLNCAPGSNNKFSCYKNSTLNKMKILWNIRHPDKQIKTDNSREIWNQLKKNMQYVCYNEACWLKQKFISNNLDDDLLHYTFSPTSPNSWKVNPNEWLSSLDIIAVMKQFEHEYKCFDFMGPSPIDYDSHIQFGECVWEELCEFDLKKQVSKGKMKIGIIFNLDPHYKSGSHWVSLFININKGEIYYFDSVGDKPHKQIQKFINNVISQGNNINIKFKYFINTKQHQFGDTECGMYSLYFIINMLRDIPFETFETHIITDKLMTEFREKYFNIL